MAFGFNLLPRASSTASGANLEACSLVCSYNLITMARREMKEERRTDRMERESVADMSRLIDIHRSSRRRAS